MYLFITSTLAIVITVVPVLIIATAMRVHRSSFLVVIVAVTLQTLLVHAVDALIAVAALAVPLQVLGGALLFRMLLGTTLVRGLGLAALCVFAALMINGVVQRFIGAPSMLAGF